MKPGEVMLFWMKVKTVAMAMAVVAMAGGAGVTTYVVLAGEPATPGAQQAGEAQKPAKEAANVPEVPAADAKVFDCLLNNVKVSVTKDGDTVKAITVTYTHTEAKREGAQQGGELVTKTHIFDVVLDDKGKRLADKDGALVTVIVGKWVEVEGRKKLTITGLPRDQFPDLEFAAAQAKFHDVTLHNAKVSVTKDGDTVTAITIRHSRSITGQDGVDVTMTDDYNVVLDDKGKRLADKDGTEVPVIVGKWNAPEGKRTLTVARLGDDTETF